MAAMTTVKVPTEVRDRLASIAHQRSTTLAGALTYCIDQMDEYQFWRDVEETMTANPPAVTELTNHSATSPAIHVQPWCCRPRR